MTDSVDITLVINNAMLGARAVDILIEGDRIASIEEHDPARVIGPEADRLDAGGCAALPGLINAQTHSAMIMLRSFADDMPLMSWLQEKIWPIEARMTEEDVYWGTRLACVEMIRSGTTCFSDMYWHPMGVARAAWDAGMRAFVAGALLDQGGGHALEAQQAAIDEQIESMGPMQPRVLPVIGPHAVYTVGEAALQWVRDRSQAADLLVHMHLSETELELEGCVEAHGCRPPAYLDRLGLLSDRFLAAHCVHLDRDEIELLAERGVHPIHNPISNLKLASGGPMPFAAMQRAGLNILIGTDGCASNNSLDLWEDLKFAALVAKHASGDPTCLPASEALRMATLNAAKALRIDAGTIEPGMLADLILVDLDHPMLFPGHELEADLVYSAQGRAVRHSVAAGRILMRNRKVADEAEIRAQVSSRWARLLGLEG